MPYKRKYKKKAKSSMMKKILKRLPKVELKFFDSQILINPAITGQVANTGAISQGSAAFQRLGREIDLKNLSARAIITKSTASTNSLLRIMLCSERVNDLNTPTLAQVLKNPAVNALRNLDETSQIRVLYDRTFTLNEDMPQRLVKINKRLNIHRKYNATTTTGGFSDIDIGSLFWCFISNESINYPTLDMDYRLRFTDA